MIVLPPGLPRRFAAVARRCVTGRPHGPPPAVVCRTAGRVLTVHTRLPNAVALEFTAPTDTADARLVIPFEVLTALAPVRDRVALRPTRGLQGEARWVDQSGPRSHPFQLHKPGRPHDPLPDVREWVPCPPGLLAALHACGQTTCRGQPTPRFALDRLCLSGAAKGVIGSDGQVAVMAGPFPLPFADDRLVPAVPVFGSPELAAQTTVSVGHADGLVAVRAGPWTVRLPVVPGRYPDVAAVLPKSRPTVGGIDEADARDLLAKLNTLPAGDDPDRPVTLALDGGVWVLARGGEQTARVHLSRSPAAGPGVRVALARTALARALTLNCLTAKVWAADRPVAFGGDGYTLVAAPLGADEVVTDPAGPATRATSPRPMPDADPDSTTHALTTPARRTPVKPDLPSRPPPDAPDPLALAEHLRLTLADAHATAARLVAVLKGRKKEQKALAQVVSSLKSLTLAPDRE